MSVTSARVVEAVEFDKVALSRTLIPSPREGLDVTICLDANGAIAAVVPINRADDYAVTLAAQVKRRWSYLPTADAMCGPQHVDTIARGAFVVQARQELAEYKHWLEQPAPIEGAVMIKSEKLESLRTAGRATIAPPRSVIDAIDGAGQRVVGSFLLCLAPSGKLLLFTTQKSTGWGEYDRLIAATIIATWKFKPLIGPGPDAESVTVCSRATFIYQP